MKIIDLLTGADHRPTSIEMEDAALPAGIARSTQPGGPPAVSETIINLGANQDQELAHAPHTCYSIRRQWTVSESSVAVPLVSAEQKFVLNAYTNYLILSPTAGQQALFVSLFGSIDWVLINSIYWPVADLVIPANGPSQFIRLPAMNNRTIAVVGWSNPLNVTTDALRLVYGYQPAGDERIILP